MAHLVTTAEDESFVIIARHISELLDEGQVSRHARFDSSDRRGSSRATCSIAQGESIVGKCII